jgi:hypothetical protein
MALNLEKYLVLNKYCLNLLGYESIAQMSDDFNEDNFNIGYDSNGRSNYANTLITRHVLLDQNELLRYDEIVKEYEEKLKKNRNEIDFHLKYFQYFAVLFTEYFLDRLSTSKETLLQELNTFSSEYCQKAEIEAIAFSEEDIKKLAYWMATGSGKTLIMHINYWQVLKYFPEWENIILITPNEGLSKQHYEEYLLSGIPAKLYNGSEESLKTSENEILIIEITKLTEEKTGEGLSIDVSFFSESKNLVFIDEGHKGQRSEEQTWKKLREAIGNGGFIFEYSATFGQVISLQRTLLLEEYQKAIIFDYSYKYFYTDGYGKDFHTFNIADEEYSQIQVELLLSASILSFYEKLLIYETHPELAKEFNIEEPLWIFVGSKVSAKSYDSDIVIILKYFDKLLKHPDELNKNIEAILSNNSNLLNDSGADIFENKFAYLKNHLPSAEDIYNKLFNGTGNLELYEIKNSDGEIALKTTLSKDYFGVINIGDVAGLKNKIAEQKLEIEVRPDNISKSQFERINERISPVKVLMGSKKFIEGWNSWRVSSMGLLNMGKSEGAQIVQLFGRGIRLKGKNLSLKREEPCTDELKALQTLSIFGLNAKYITAFLDSIENEVEQPKEYEIEIKFNDKNSWENKLYTFQKDDQYNFSDEVIELEYKENIATRISIDLRPKIKVTTGFQVDTGMTRDEENINPLTDGFYSKLINWNDLILSINTFKLARGFNNLILDSQTIRDIIIAGKYKILLNKAQLINEFSIRNRIQRLAESVIKDYIVKYYAEVEKDYLTKHLKVELLNSKTHSELFPNDNTVILKVPKDYITEVNTLIADINKFYIQDIKRIPTIHFDRHLYSPLAVYKKGKRFEEIKTVPVKLNEGETNFITHLREYIIGKAAGLSGIEIFILRNISKKGLGFFVESSSFYPDFILWIKKNNKQEIIFVDPKGILLLGNVNHDKVKFCTNTIKEIESSVKEQLRNASNNTELLLDAFILSVTPYDVVKGIFEDGKKPKEYFEQNKILFLDDKKDYIEKIFAGKLI